MLKTYNPKESLSEQFPNIRPADLPNLQTVLEALVKENFQVRLAGSALERTDYNDIDLGAWKTTRQKPVESLLGKLGVTEYERIPIAATYVHGWVRFEYQGTRFDIICTSDEYYLGYFSGK